jgi:hypothetical protein
MKPRPKAIIDQLLMRIGDLEEALEYAEAIIAMWESGEVQKDADAMWDRIKGGAQTVKTNMIKEAIAAHWGEKCADYVKGCPCCDAWRQFEKLMKGRK